MKYKLLIVFGVFLVSFAAIFVKKLDDINPPVIAMYRLGIAGLILFPVGMFQKDRVKLKISDFSIIFLAGLLISLHYLSWFTSLRYTSVTSSTLIICTEPLVALLFGFILYREKLSVIQFLLLLLALFGVSIVALGDLYLSKGAVIGDVPKDAIIGDVLTFIAVVFFVIYLFIGQNMVKKHSFILYTSVLFINAGIILLIYNIIMGYNLTSFSVTEWFYLILMAIIPNAGQVIFNYSLRYVNSSLIATSILLEPIFATILAVIILRDNIFLYQILGGIIIIVSVLVYIKIDKITVEV